MATAKELVFDELAAWRRALHVASEILESLSDDQIKVIADRGLLDLDCAWIEGICAKKDVDHKLTGYLVETLPHEALK